VNHRRDSGTPVNHRRDRGTPVNHRRDRGTPVNHLQDRGTPDHHRSGRGTPHTQCFPLVKPRKHVRRHQLGTRVGHGRQPHERATAPTERNKRVSPIPSPHSHAAPAAATLKRKKRTSTHPTRGRGEARHGRRTHLARIRQLHDQLVDVAVIAAGRHCDTASGTAPAAVPSGGRRGRPSSNTTGERRGGHTAGGGSGLAEMARPRPSPTAGCGGTMAVMARVRPHHNSKIMAARTAQLYSTVLEL